MSVTYFDSVPLVFVDMVKAPAIGMDIYFYPERYGKARKD